MNKLAKYFKKISRVFTTVNTQPQNLKEADSGLSDSEDEDEASHFHMSNSNFSISYFQLSQLDEEFEPHITSIFNQTEGRNFGIKPKLDLRDIILMDSQLTMDLFCKSIFIGEDR